MDLLTLQHVIVTLTAGAAAWIVIRRVFTAVTPSGPKCSSCPSASATERRQELTAEAKLLTLIR